MIVLEYPYEDQLKNLQLEKLVSLITEHSIYNDMFHIYKISIFRSLLEREFPQLYKKSFKNSELTDKLISAYKTMKGIDLVDTYPVLFYPLQADKELRLLKTLNKMKGLDLGQLNHIISISPKMQNLFLMNKQAILKSILLKEFKYNAVMDEQEIKLIELYQKHKNENIIQLYPALWNTRAL